MHKGVGRVGLQLHHSLWYKTVSLSLSISSTFVVRITAEWPLELSTGPEEVVYIGMHAGSSKDSPGHLCLKCGLTWKQDD